MLWLADSWLWDIPGGLWLLGLSYYSGGSLRAQGKVDGWVHQSSPSLSPGPLEEVQLLGQRLLGFAGFLDLTRGGRVRAFSVATGQRLS